MQWLLTLQEGYIYDITTDKDINNNIDTDDNNYCRLPSNMYNTVYNDKHTIGAAAFITYVHYMW